MGREISPFYFFNFLSIFSVFLLLIFLFPFFPSSSLFFSIFCFPPSSQSVMPQPIGWLLCDILCDEGGERESAWRQILPHRADSSFTMSGESCSSSPSSSTLRGHWISLMPLLSCSATLHTSCSATLHTSCSLLTPMEVILTQFLVTAHLF